MAPQLQRPRDARVCERIEDERRGDHRRAVLVRAVVRVGAVPVLSAVLVSRSPGVLVPVISTGVGRVARGGRARLMVGLAVAQLAQQRLHEGAERGEKQDQSGNNAASGHGFFTRVRRTATLTEPNL